MNYYILVFESTHKVLKAEKELLAVGIKFDIIPTPKEITSDCGLSVRIPFCLEVLQQIEKTLEGKNTGYKIHEKK